MPRPAISVIIPNYNGLKLLQKNLPAVLAELAKKDELIIVDDASTDDSLIWLETEFAKQANKKDINLKIIKNPQNLRFAESCNKGFKTAQHNLVFLLNNDVSPHKNCVNYLVAHFDTQNKNLFAVGCLEKEIKDGQIEYHGKNKLWFERGLFMHSKANDMKSGETAWVIGGSGLFDRTKWLKLGGFDKLYYPAYWEDIDLSFRARQRGWQVLFEQNAVVNHNHESTNQDVFGDQKLTAMSWHNSLKFTWKNADLWQKIAFVLWQPYWIFKRFCV